MRIDFGYFNNDNSPKIFATATSKSETETLFIQTLCKAEMATEYVLNESDEKVEIYSDIKVIMDNMDHEERILVVEMLWGVILADGIIDDFESNLIRRVCGLLHISGAESSEAKQRASIKN